MKKRFQTNKQKKTNLVVPVRHALRLPRVRHLLEVRLGRRVPSLGIGVHLSDLKGERRNVVGVLRQVEVERRRKRLEASDVTSKAGSQRSEVLGVASLNLVGNASLGLLIGLELELRNGLNNTVGLEVPI